MSLNSTNLCQLLNIKLPIIQGGMAWSSDANLASAVSNAGGLGIIGCGGRDFSWIESQIKIAISQTSFPFALNFPLEGVEDAAVERAMIEAISQGVKLFTVSGSQRYNTLLKNFGDKATIIPLVGTVMQAKLAERSGAKAIICEGQEAGGSIGKLSLFSLLPQIVDAVFIPVIAAGGIADGRGINAAMALGASGVQLGTRFLASDECPISDSFKEKIIKAKDVDTTVIFKNIGRTARVIKNKYSSKYLTFEKNNADNEELFLISRGSLRAAATGDVVGGALMAGESSGLIKSVAPTRKIIETLVKQSVISQIINNHDPIVGKYLKHTPPILLVDEIVDVQNKEYCLAKSNFDSEKWFFKCHYPGNPIMPGSLLMELMSQVMTIAVTSEKNDNSHKLQTVISQVEKIKFSRPVFPNIEIMTYAEIKTVKRSVIKGSAWCKSNNELICECEMVLVLTSF